MTYQWHPVQIPFGAGLDQEPDTRASSPPTLDIALNVMIDQLQGLQTRFPYASLSANILGGGTLTNPRKVVANGDELLLFTDTALYSWSAEATAWALKGTHLAVAVDEESKFSATGDQINCDRAQLGGVVFYAWSVLGRVWVSAKDASSGAILLAPTNPSLVGANGTLPRLVALQTRVLLFWVNVDGDLAVISLDPANIATSVAATWTAIVASPNYASGYDATQMVGADSAVVVCMSSPNTSYRIVTVTAGLTVANHTTSKTADAVIAVSSVPGGNNLVTVLRSNTVDLFADVMDVSTFTLTSTDVFVGYGNTAFTQVACATRSVKDGGYYRTYVFWDDNEQQAIEYLSYSNWVDTSGATGTTSEASTRFVRNVSPASRAFDYNGQIYLWTAYAMAALAAGTTPFGNQTALQNTYYLYRDDGFLCAQAAPALGGGFAAATSRLPGVQLIGGSTEFAWCGTVRRIVPLGDAGSGYSARTPRDVVFTFDSNDARRCARIGKTLYIGCGEGVLQYDGSGLYEVGFHVYPQVDLSTGSGGSIDDGVHAYETTYRWDNAVGERERSTSSAAATVTAASSNAAKTTWTSTPLYVTHKNAAVTSGYAPAIELWRTTKNPTSEAPFYLVTSLDPSVVSTSNGYVNNDTTASGTGSLFDKLADATVAVNETNPENGAVLPCLAPPACKLVMATQDRLFLAGIAGDPDRVWYSRLRGDGEVASFNDALTIDVPHVGGDITALAYMDETLVVFRQRAVYVIPGTGFDNTGGGINFGPPHVSSTDCGAISQETVALTPFGLIFKSSKGWYRLDSKWGVSYIGGKVKDYDSDVIVATHVVENRHEIRCLSTARMLVYNYRADQWLEWTISDGIAATQWQGTYVYLSSSTAKVEQTTYTLADYDIDVETSWIKLNDLQGAGSVRRVQPLGAWQSSFQLRLRLARDYERDPLGGGGWNYYDDVTWTPDTSVVGDKLQLKHGPSRPKCSALKARLTTIGASGEMLRLTGLALEVGVSPILNRRLSAAQKV